MLSGGHASRRSPAALQRSRPDLSIPVGKNSRPQAEGLYPCQPASPAGRRAQVCRAITADRNAMLHACSSLLAQALVCWLPR